MLCSREVYDREGSKEGRPVERELFEEWLELPGSFKLLESLLV